MSELDMRRNPQKDKLYGHDLPQVRYNMDLPCLLLVLSHFADLINALQQPRRNHRHIALVSFLLKLARNVHPTEIDALTLRIQSYTFREHGWVGAEQ